MLQNYTSTGTGLNSYSTPNGGSSPLVDSLKGIGSSIMGSMNGGSGSALQSYQNPFGIPSISNTSPAGQSLNGGPVSPVPLGHSVTVTNNSPSTDAGGGIVNGKYQSTGINAGIDPYTLQPVGQTPTFNQYSPSAETYKYTPSSTIDSTSLASASLPSLLDTHDQQLSDLFGTNPNGKVASDNLYSTVANQLYNTSLYSPDQLQGIQSLSDINSKVFATQLADQRMIKQLQENGQLTKGQAADFTSESTRRNNADLANLAVAQNAQANSNGVLADYQKNSVDSLSTLLGSLKGEAIAPGSSVFNPITGVQYQGNGGSPQAILGYAQQLIANDQSQGTLRMTPTGEIDTNYYQSAAQQAFSGGQGLGNNQTPQPQGDNQLTQIAQALVSGTLSPSNIPQGLNQATVLNAANQLSMQTTGQPFDANKAQANYAATQAALTQNATTFRALSAAQSTAVSHLDDLQNYFNALPASSKTGAPAVNGISNWVASNFGSGSVQSYNTTLQAARGEIAKVLAGGGAPSDSENKAADAVLPDNMSPNQIAGAIQAAKTLMAQKIAEYSSTSNVPQYGQDNGQQQTGSGVVQTKAGAIPTNW